MELSNGQVFVSNFMLSCDRNGQHVGLRVFLYLPLRDDGRRICVDDGGDNSCCKCTLQENIHVRDESLQCIVPITEKPEFESSQVFNFNCKIYNKVSKLFSKITLFCASLARVGTSSVKFLLAPACPLTQPSKLSIKL